VFSVDFLALLMGLLERNQLSIITPTPLLPLFLNDDPASSESTAHRLAERVGANGIDALVAEGKPLLETEWGYFFFDVLCWLVGSGLFAVTSLLNHACLPNARLFKRGYSPDDDDDGGAVVDGVPVRDGSCVVVAVRDIEEGEEIFISYVDEDDEDEDGDGDGDEDGEGCEDGEEGEERREWRRVALKEYGISCSCAKCT
jgi:hypothetical protein